MILSVFSLTFSFVRSIPHLSRLMDGVYLKQKGLFFFFFFLFLFFFFFFFFLPLSFIFCDFLRVIFSCDGWLVPSMLEAACFGTFFLRDASFTFLFGALSTEALLVRPRAPRSEVS